MLLGDALPWLGFLFVPDAELVIADDARAQLGDDAAAVLAASLDALESLPAFTAAAIEEALRAALLDGLGLKPRSAFAPLRVAISGQRVSPPLFESMEVLGRESSLARLRRLLTDLGA